jgi:putative endonuclease
MTRKETGILGEKLAKDFLKKRGYRIIETNYRCRQGEIDIVARQKDCLVFIEVRTKSTHSYGSPEESITPAKRAKMRSTAEYYRQSHKDLLESWRIDFVAVELDAQGKPTRVEIIENAVGEE